MASIIRIQMRRDTVANWTSANPTLAQGESGLETDTGNIKMGDGLLPWNSLPYVAVYAATTLAAGTTLTSTDNYIKVFLDGKWQYARLYQET